jgi:alanine-synthesizing transaminase
MFSSRLEWSLRPNRIALALEQARRDGIPLLDLTLSNPTAADLEYPVEEIVEALAQPGALIYQPDAAGLKSARQDVAAWYARRGALIPEQRVFITASTSESYSYLFKLLCDPGDEILAPRPSYPLFEHLAGLESVTVRQYPLRYHHGWWVDFDALERAASPLTRAVVIVNPNNPTGSYWKRHEAEQLSALCAARGWAIISDEVFEEYRLETGEASANAVSLAGFPTEALSFCLGGLSKAAGLPQMKLGWMVIGGAGELVNTAMQRLEWIADTYLSVGAPVQCAAGRLLTAGERVAAQIKTRIAANMAFLRTALAADSHCCRLLRVEGGWSATLQVPRTRTEEEWCVELIQHHQVVVHPGFFFDFEREAFLIISLLTPEPVFQQGITRLLELCSHS